MRKKMYKQTKVLHLNKNIKFILIISTLFGIKYGLELSPLVHIIVNLKVHLLINSKFHPN